MKKLLLIVAFFIGVTTMVEAQRGTGQRPSQSESGQRPQRMNPEERIERQTSRLKEQLSLTDEQTGKVKALLTSNMEKQRAEWEKRRAEMEQARENQQVDRDKMRAEMKARMDAQDAEIKALLTDEQKAKYEKVIKEREERMKNRQGPPERDE